MSSKLGDRGKNWDPESGTSCRPCKSLRNIIPHVLIVTMEVDAAVLTSIGRTLSELCLVLLGGRCLIRPLTLDHSRFSSLKHRKTVQRQTLYKVLSCWR